MSTIKTDKIIPIGLTLTVEGSAVFTAGISANSTMSVGGAVTANSFVGNGTIPIGGIIMWSGAVANIPTDWALCNGLNGTPDLRGRFVVGATSGTGAGYTAGSVGGTANSIVVSHTHAITDPGHAHSLPNYPNNNLQAGSRDTANAYLSGTQNTSTSVTGISIGATGSSGTNANLPPYHALAYIMRVA